MSDSDSEEIEEFVLQSRQGRIRKQGSPGKVPRKMLKPTTPLVERNKTTRGRRGHGGEGQKATKKCVNQDVSDDSEAGTEESSSDENEEGFTAAGKRGQKRKNNPVKDHNKSPTDTIMEADRVRRNRMSRASSFANGSYVDADENGGYGNRTPKRAPRMSASDNQRLINLNNSIYKALKEKQRERTEKETITDPVQLLRIHEKCLSLFDKKRILPNNAFNLEMIECMDNIIDCSGFDKYNLALCGKTLEVGTKIYTCRVENTHNEVMKTVAELSLSDNRNQKKKVDGQQNAQGEDVSGNGNEDNDEDGEQLDRRGRQAKTNFKALRKQNKCVVPVENEDSLKMEFPSTGLTTFWRRETLKDYFFKAADYYTEFDYVTDFLEEFETDHAQKHSERLKNAEELAILKNNALNIPAPFINANLKEIKELAFRNMEHFDPTLFDAWGQPLESANPNLVQEALVAPAEIPLMNEDLVYDPLSRPDVIQTEEDQAMGDFVLDMDDVDPMDVGNLSIAYSGEMPLPTGVHAAQMKSLQKIADRASCFSGYAKLKYLAKSLYCWSGPRFKKPARPRNMVRTEGMKRKKRTEDPRDDGNFRDFDYCLGAFAKKHRKRTPRNVDLVSLVHRTQVTADETDYDRSLGVEETDNMHPMFSDTVGIPDVFLYFMDADGDVLGNIEDELRRVGILTTDQNEELEDAAECEGMGIHTLPQFQQEGHDYSDPEDMRQNDDGMDMDFCNASQQEIPLDDMDIQMGDGDLNFFGFQSADALAALSKAPDSSLDYCKQPKPIDMHRLKSTVFQILKENFGLDNNGKNNTDREMRLTFEKLLAETQARVDARTKEHLSIHLVVVALLHVVVEHKFFMDSGVLGGRIVPDIVCRAQNWIHSQHIPVDPDDDSDD